MRTNLVFYDESGITKFSEPTVLRLKYILKKLLNSHRTLTKVAEHIEERLLMCMHRERLNRSHLILIFYEFGYPTYRLYRCKYMLRVVKINVTVRVLNSSFIFAPPCL